MQELDYSERLSEALDKAEMVAIAVGAKAVLLEHLELVLKEMKYQKYKP